MPKEPWGDAEPTIPVKGTLILDLYTKSERVDWTNEDKLVNKMFESFGLKAGRK